MTDKAASGNIRKRYRPAESGWVIALMMLLVATNVIALVNADPDFYLPDPFRGMAIGLLLTFLVTTFVPWSFLRNTVRLLVAVLVTAVLLLELKAGAPQEPNSSIQVADDPLLRYHYAPGGGLGDIEGNSQGLADLERDLAKPDDVIRVAILTGSIANDGSIPFEERFFRRLEHMVEDVVPGKRVEVINVSCEGYSTLEQVRFLETVGLRYDPDVVIVAFMLTAASFQHGGYRRIGNSFFAFRFLPMLSVASEGSICPLFAPFFDSYTFELVVQNPLERLQLLSQIHDFETLFASMPVLEEFDDPHCQRLYERAEQAATNAGIDIISVVDGFVGTPYTDFVKEGQRWDMCHPNSAGHQRIAEGLAAGLTPVLQSLSEKL